MRHPRVLNVADAAEIKREHGTKFASRLRRLGTPTGSKTLGCMWHEVPPGKAAFPKHFHCANEEAAYILEGEGMLRIGNDEVPVRAGDYLAFPTGPDNAHQLINTGLSPLRYLGMSTNHLTEVVGYPDSKKIAATAAASEEAWTTGQFLVRHISFEKDAAGYYDGEDSGA